MFRALVVFDIMTDTVCNLYIFIPVLVLDVEYNTCTYVHVLYIDDGYKDELPAHPPPTPNIKLYIYFKVVTLTILF